MPERIDCRQEKTGNCTGCPVQQEVVNALRIDLPAVPVVDIVRRVAQENCPTGRAPVVRLEGRGGELVIIG